MDYFRSPHRLGQPLGGHGEQAECRVDDEAVRELRPLARIGVLKWRQPAMAECYFFVDAGQVVAGTPGQYFPDCRGLSLPYIAYHVAEVTLG